MIWPSQIVFVSLAVHYDDSNLKFLDVMNLISAGWGPYAYFRMLEETSATTSTPNGQNQHSCHAQSTEALEGSQAGQSQSCLGCVGFSGERDHHNPTLDEIECGNVRK